MYIKCILNSSTSIPDCSPEHEAGTGGADVIVACAVPSAALAIALAILIVSTGVDPKSKLLTKYRQE